MVSLSLASIRSARFKVRHGIIELVQVRLRAGSYLSPPIVLSTRPQAVVFPLPRPETTPVEEVISIEGNANDVVITSDLNPLPRVFNVVGVSAFNVTWKPMKTC